MYNEIMSGKMIGTVYFYLVSVISLILLVIGIHSSVTYFLNASQYDEYPLRYLGEDCENFGYPFKGPYPAEIAQDSQASVSAEERLRLTDSCKRRVEAERKQYKLEDIRNSIVFTLVGSILFLIHFPQARKLSRE